MNFLKTIFALIGAIVVVGGLFVFIAFGDKIAQVKELDSGAMPAYMEMFGTVLKTGDAAKGMVLEYEVKDGLSKEDVAETMTALVEEFNMRLTSDVKMYTIDDAKDNEVKSARIFSMCSLPIAKKFLNYSHEYGAFMPCRIMMIEMGNGKKYLYSMDLTLMIHGGKPLPEAMLKLATKVDNSMRTIARRSAAGDF
jgi:uncharacterized protein (DUF302 family)